jgi:hypothetical protein
MTSDAMIRDPRRKLPSGERLRFSPYHRGMSLRVDLYPVSLSRLASVLGPKGWEHGRAIAEELHPEAKPADGSLVDELLSGRLRASQPSTESAALAALISSFAYRLRDTQIDALFDLGAAWNALDKVSRQVKGEEQRLARALVDGRPLVGAAIAADWNRYAWAFAREFETLEELLSRASASATSDVARMRAWLRRLPERKLDMFVAIG